jgi:hypothetical protein
MVARTPTGEVTRDAVWLEQNVRNEVGWTYDMKVRLGSLTWTFILRSPSSSTLRRNQFTFPSFRFFSAWTYLPLSSMTTPFVIVVSCAEVVFFTLTSHG